MHAEPRVPMEKVQFFKWSERQTRRLELANGRPILPEEQSRAHSAICTNIVFQLASMLDTRRYSVIGGRFALETGPRSIRLPDVMVEPYINDNAIRATDALLLVEVLSPSTMHVDSHEKLDEYEGLAALKELGRMRRMYLRASMPPSKRPSFRITLPLADIYRNVTVRDG
jgi:Uma2 family endonuclease